MDAPIAPSAVRTAEEGPAYDLISLGLVVFTILLVGVWTTHYFREAPFDNRDFEAVKAGVDERTSAGRLQAARWADFNLRSGSNDISKHFCEELKEALVLEKSERTLLLWKVSQLDPVEHQRERVEAQAALGENSKSLKGPAAEFAQRWYQARAEWIDARDARGFNIAAHRDFAIMLDDMGMSEEARRELDKVRRARPDWPVPPLKDDHLPVIREQHPK